RRVSGESRNDREFGARLMKDVSVITILHDSGSYQAPIGSFSQGNGVQVRGVLIPQFIALPALQLVLDPEEPEGPVCELPPLDGDSGVIQYAWAVARQTGPGKAPRLRRERYTVYVTVSDVPGEP
ncbi:MAG: hypothetical protein ABDH31_08065, partial [Chlorobiota bacterium]